MSTIMAGGSFTTGLFVLIGQHVKENGKGELDKQLVAELKWRLPPEVSRHLRQMILYGSRARGEAAEDSDLDLVALVDEKTPELEEALDDIAYKVMWEHDSSRSFH